MGTVSEEMMIESGDVGGWGTYEIAGRVLVVSGAFEDSADACRAWAGWWADGGWSGTADTELAVAGFDAGVVQAGHHVVDVVDGQDEGDSVTFGESGRLVGDGWVDWSG